LLSLTVIRQADEIEKLARSVKDEDEAFSGREVEDGAGEP
jgi:hypothetical protein